MQGHDFPEDLSPLGPRRSTAAPARSTGARCSAASCAAARQGVPITNYGLVIAYQPGHLRARAAAVPGRPRGGAGGAGAAGRARTGGAGDRRPAGRRRRRRPLLTAARTPPSPAPPPRRRRRPHARGHRALAARDRRGAARDAVGRGGRGAAPLRRRRGPPPRPRRGQQLLRARLHLLRHPRRQPRRRALPRAPRTTSSPAPARRVAFGYGTLVMQSGEDYGITTEWMAGVLRRIKAETGLAAITLSLGERPDEDLAAWREAGADRYLLRFETSDDELYRRIHPDLPGKVSDRMRHPAPPAGARLRGRHRHHGRHPRPDARQHRRRHRAVPRHGHGHDRHRPVPAPPRDAAGAGVRAAARRGRLADGPGAQQRAHDLQGASRSRAWRARTPTCRPPRRSRWSTRPAAAPTGCSAAPTW